MEVNSNLLDQVRLQLDITWHDPDTDKNVERIALSAQSAIAHQIGVAETFDFSVPGIENTLVLAYCLYLRNKVDLKLFYENYLPLILQARAIHEVEQAVENGDV